jgi:hypothetical protein
MVSDSCFLAVRPFPPCLSWGIGRYHFGRCKGSLHTLSSFISLGPCFPWMASQTGIFSFWGIRRTSSTDVHLCVSTLQVPQDRFVVPFRTPVCHEHGFSEEMVWYVSILCTVFAALSYLFYLPTSFRVSVVCRNFARLRDLCALGKRAPGRGGMHGYITYIHTSYTSYLTSGSGLLVG